MATYPGGPLTIQDFEALWESVVDPSYAEAFQQAGEGAGYEVFTQGFAQLARVSQAIDASLGALYILPWSGQTSPPATGPAKATVNLTFRRTLRMSEPLILTAGSVFYEEQEPDWAPDEGIIVQTGRRYTLLADLVFQPGQQGPLTALAQAERPGAGYNNPQPGSINLVAQPGSGYFNAAPTGATLLAPPLPVPKGAPNFAVFQLAVADQPDVVVPEHVGQYVLITAGDPAAGTSFRMTAYQGPAPFGNPPTGGTVTLDYAVSIADLVGGAGGFAPREVVAGPNGYLLFRGQAVIGGNLVATFTYRSGSIAPGDVLTGPQSGATMTASMFLVDPLPAASAPGAVGWRVLDWVSDWGLTVTNQHQPGDAVADPSPGIVRGTAATLDALGRERGLPRLQGEADDPYRARISVIADVVTPNAVKRALTRTLTDGLGVPWNLREVGTADLPGFFWGDGQGNGDFFDYDAVVPTGGSLTGFVSGERVRQTVAGVNATGRALVDPQTGHLVGIAGVSLNTPFVVGAPIVGLRSGASTTPTAIAGGVSAANQWKLYLDYLRFRAYFLVEVGRSDDGDFGFFWGVGNAPGTGGLIDFFDAAPVAGGFYDGTSIVTNDQMLAAWGTVDEIRAGGVYVDFVPMRSPP